MNLNDLKMNLCGFSSFIFRGFTFATAGEKVDNNS